MNPRQLGVIDLGRRPYRETLAIQRAFREARIEGSIPHDVLLLVEHDPVYTMGRGTQDSSLPESSQQLAARGADVIEIERGGDVTWHGPGQLVGYPILNLSEHREDLHWYLRSLERMLITTLADCGLTGNALPGKTGVWVNGRKIGSIGVHVRRWVTLHGFALNVQPDLEWFKGIVPCGIAGVEMTSIVREIGTNPGGTVLWDRTREAVVCAMCATLDIHAIPETLEQWSAEVHAVAEACDSASERPPFIQYG